MGLCDRLLLVYELVFRSCDFVDRPLWGEYEPPTTKSHEYYSKQIDLLVRPGLTPDCGPLTYYKGQALEKKYKADLICYGQIIVELKACEGLTGREVAQLLNYLKATRMRVGLLFNFGSSVRLEWQRYVL